MVTCAGCGNPLESWGIRVTNDGRDFAYVSLDTADSTEGVVCPTDNWEICQIKYRSRKLWAGIDI